MKWGQIEFYHGYQNAFIHHKQLVRHTKFLIKVPFKFHTNLQPHWADAKEQDSKLKGERILGEINLIRLIRYMYYTLKMTDDYFLFVLIFTQKCVHIQIFLLSFTSHFSKNSIIYIIWLGKSIFPVVILLKDNLKCYLILCVYFNWAWKIKNSMYNHSCVYKNNILWASVWWKNKNYCTIWLI